ncbi:BRO-N domain-containing protein [Candidatus Regiella endosymbiont of Tuberolachnus salignus]|uniref:BRO-N domain-containing protein n=1 Tax=Candidatus Regiella endosymbiont of Tuberolachnus salignus TaxID=3077956 RepID=UPI0030D1A3A6
MILETNREYDAMNNTSVIPFTFESHVIRIVVVNGDPWFIVVDVCSALGLSNPTKAILNLDCDEKALTSIQGLSRGNEKANIISESGMYILVLRSRDAVKQGTVPHRFRKWVTNELLPQIRKTGSYQAPQQPKYHPQSPELLSHDDLSHLTRLVWCMSNGFHFNQSWSNAIWYALRQVTGIPSPQRFEVQKIPLLAEECRRIYTITNQFKAVIFEAEKQVIRRCLRKRENAERVISEMQQSLEGAAQSNVSTLNSTLAQWEEREINLFAQRSHYRVAHHSSY